MLERCYIKDFYKHLLALFPKQKGTIGEIPLRNIHCTLTLMRTECQQMLWQHVQSITYIPLQQKTTGLGALCWVRPPTQRFCVTYTNMLVSKMPTQGLSTQCKILDPQREALNTQCKPVEYSLRWVSWHQVWHWPCNVFCVNFICVG